MKKKDKIAIANKLKDISKEDAIRDYHQLQNIDLSKVSNETRIGNKFVDYFTFLPRLETISKKGMSYFDFIHNTEYHKKPYIKRLIDYQDGDDWHVILYRIFRLHCGSISLFKPLTAMEIYQKYRPQSVLDFTMGWGGRLVGACVMGVPNYIGIDSNLSLKKPYADMKKMLSQLDCHTTSTLLFKDALSVNYSKLHYDCVFTSPPYFDVEIYEHMPAAYETEEDWVEAFYAPLFTETYKHLKRGGHYILNVPVKLYKEVCIPLFGAAKTRIPLKKKTRPKNGYTTKDYDEYIYVWKK